MITSTESKEMTVSNLKGGQIKIDVWTITHNHDEVRHCVFYKHEDGKTLQAVEEELEGAIGMLQWAIIGYDKKKAMEVAKKEADMFIKQDTRIAGLKCPTNVIINQACEEACKRHKVEDVEGLKRLMKSTHIHTMKIQGLA